jgi:homocitrate synthase
VATPNAVAARVKALRERYPNVDLEGHFHNDRGFTTVNALSAVKAGMRFMNTSLLGLGERSGITSMTALIYNLYIDKAYEKLDGYHLRGSYPINVLMADKIKMLVPHTEPVCLTNRTHAAGVHGKAVINNSETYEAHPLDQFGVSESEVLLGPLTGWNVIHYFLHEICGFDVDDDKAKAITATYKKRVYTISNGTSPATLLIDIAQNEFGLKAISVPEEFRGQVVQRMTDPDDDGVLHPDEVGTVSHVGGIILRSKR